MAQLLDHAGATLRDDPVQLPGEARVVLTSLLQPNTWNPNKQDAETFTKEKASLKRFGFVVPIIVRKVPRSEKYEIIDGEHRWKAANELNMEYVPIFDLGPVSDHEAMQLTVILNELRGKPEEKKLGDVLKHLLASDTIERLTEVMPYSKEQYSTIAKLPEYDWGKLQRANAERSERRWVERIFRLPKEVAETLDAAIAQAKDGRDDVDDAQALETIAKEFIG